MIYCKYDNEVECILYDGTGLGLYEGEKIDYSFFHVLYDIKYIIDESGNLHTSEYYFEKNKYEIFSNTYVLNILKQQVIVDYMKKVYEKEIKNHLRNKKLERILNEVK